MDEMTNVTPRYLGKDRTAASVFSHRVNGSQNDPARVKGMLAAVQESKFKKVVFVTTDLLNVYTLPLPKKSASIPNPAAYVRVQAFNYLVKFLRDNAELILKLNTNIEFDFLPFYQIRYADERLNAPLRDLFIPKNSSTERYSLTEVQSNITHWAKGIEDVLSADDLIESTEYNAAFEKNEELYQDEGSYKTAVDVIAKQHENDEKTRPKEDNKSASRRYQFGEGVLNKYLAKCNKDNSKDISKHGKAYDCLLYSGGEISTSLKYLEKHKIRSKYRLEQVVYNDLTGQIEAVKPTSPKAHSAGRSSSEEDSAEGTDTFSSKSTSTSTSTSVNPSRSGSVESPVGSLSGSPSDGASPLDSLVPPSVAAGEPKKAPHVFSLGRKKPQSTQGRGMFDTNELKDSLRSTMEVASEYGGKPGWTFEATIEDTNQGKKATARATVPPNLPVLPGNKK